MTDYILKVYLTSSDLYRLEVYYQTKRIYEERVFLSVRSAIRKGKRIVKKHKKGKMPVHTEMVTMWIEA